MKSEVNKDNHTVSVEELQLALKRGEPVVVLDVSSSNAREEWYIPGSIHVDAYEALKRNDPEALNGVDLPDDRPIVTVCPAGNTSRTAAEILRQKGLHAVTLDGGMKAWSMAHNTARFSPERTTAEIVQVRRTGKGCLSYLVGAGGEAAVIDASLPPEEYVHLAEIHGWRITRVLDTHIHADHLSRSRALAEMTGVTLLLPDQRRVSFPYDPVRDGETISIGKAQMRAIHTPGHTDESMCYLLDQAALFTGDTLFIDGVGRPDLKGKSGETRERAALLYDSLQRILREIAEDVMVLPGHTSHPVPFDQEVVGDTLGNVRSRIDTLSLSKKEFVKHLLGRIPPTPPNFEKIVALNEAGATAVDEILDLEAGANRCAIS